MNKYLKWFINSIVMVVFGFIGVLYSLNLLLMGLHFLPEVMAKTDEILGPNPSWLEWHLLPGLIPLFYLLTVLALCVFSMFLITGLVRKVYIEKILVKKKEAKDE